MTTLVNGRETENLPVADRGLQYGDGLFETIALKNGKLLLWERHLQRLVKVAGGLDLHRQTDSCCGKSWIRSSAPSHGPWPKLS